MRGISFCPLRKLRCLCDVRFRHKRLQNWEWLKSEMIHRDTVGSWVAVAAFVATLATLATSSYARPRHNAASHSLCRANEQVVFQCPIGGRMASVCAGRSLDVPTVQYRFGRPGKIELEHPKAAGKLSWARTGYSGGGELQINFSNEGYRYVLYSRMVRTGFGAEGNNPKSETGVAVIRRNKVISDRRCNDPDKEAFVGNVDTLLPQGEFTKWWELDE